MEPKNNQTANCNSAEKKTSWKFNFNIWFWQHKINEVLDVFFQLGLLDLTKIKQMNFTKLNSKGRWDNLEDFAIDFQKNLPFAENITEQDKKMLSNFFNYAIYQLAYQCYLKKIIFTFVEHNPYNKENKIVLNHKKRDWYYDFLDDFKKIPNYNLSLRKLLNILL
ncbi:hypothetical protein [Mycoplasma hafezii]|uniref:hypothetical protein n=1 Tax=Mycoplasma hafezii TaxID=525886 RepID=UPI003CE9E87C